SRYSPTSCACLAPRSARARSWSGWPDPLSALPWRIRSSRRLSGSEDDIGVGSRLTSRERRSGSVSHAETAVDGDHRARDVGRVVAREEADRLGDLGRVGEATGGDGLAVGGLQILRQSLGHLGVDVAGRDHVRGDAARAELTGQRAGDADQAGLGGRVVDLSRRSVQPHHRADEHDAALLLAHHRLDDPLDRAEGAGEVGVQHRLEGVVAHPQQQLVVGDPGVRDQHLDRSVRLLDGLDRRVEAVAVGDVRGDGEGPLRAALARAAGDRHPVPAAEELPGDRAADAAVPSGDQDTARLGDGVGHVNSWMSGLAELVAGPWAAPTGAVGACGLTPRRTPVLYDTWRESVGIRGGARPPTSPGRCYPMAYRFNPPPNWPIEDSNWSPPPGWQPDPSWGPAPEGWNFWVADDQPSADPAPEAQAPAEEQVPAGDD